MFRLIVLLFFVVGLSQARAQQLVWMQQNSEGRVIANIHPNHKIDPCQPLFSNEYDRIDEMLCYDSLFTHLDFHPVSGEDKQEDEASRKCLSTLDFSFGFIFCHDEWAASSDLFSVLRVPNGSMQWDPQGKSTFRLNSNRHDYVCSNDQHGYDSSDDQLWKLDAKGRVQSILIYNTQMEEEVSGKLVERIDLAYTPAGKIKRIVHRDIHNGLVANSGQWQKEWYYDEQGRDQMMVQYEGKLRQFNKAEIQRFNSDMDLALKSDGSSFEARLDSVGISTLVLYKYGKFGLGQVNAFYFPKDYYDIMHLYTDSIFYDGSGKILRYSGGYDMQGSSGELLYTYDEQSGRLQTVVGRSKGCINRNVQQWLYYTDKKVSSLREKIYDNQNYDENGNYDNSAQVLQEERVYTYRYKLRGQKEAGKAFGK